ncbi:MAG: phosphate ABC transporter substrate-binding protein PstS [Rubrivivax sp.]|nr:phosphate ABC transporter substrate-binding protein PstS [Pyrinomonadaceae bacterium]
MIKRAKISSRALLLSLAASLAALMFACGAPQPVGTGGGGASTSGGTVRLQGTGASFPAPIYQKWVSEYGKAHPNIEIDYQSTGSGQGIKDISGGTVAFGATDKPMSDDELKAAKGGELLHIPTVLGAVVITYNLPGNPELKFSPDVIADIYLGKITKWDDARIKADNPGAQLPASNIAVVARADGSGTSAVFTEYLSKVSPEWKEKVGTGTNPNWPTGQRAAKNEGVTAAIKQNPNTLGYVELAYAVQIKLPVAALKNKAGNFVKPTLEAVTAAAAESLASTPDDMRVSITDAAGATAYPISSYTYILAYKNQTDAVRGKALVDFLWWALHDGQAVTKDPQYPYAALPAEVVKRAEAKINSITSDGKPLRSYCVLRIAYLKTGRS